MSKSKKLIIIIASVIVAAGLLVGGIFFYKSVTYKNASLAFEAGNFDEARETFVKLSGYKDSMTMVTESDYRKAKDLCEKNNFDEAKDLFASLGKYSDKEGDFLEKILREHIDVDDFTTSVGHDYINIANCRQYWAHGGAEIGLEYFYDKDVLDEFYYRVTDRNEEAIGFIDYYPDGRVKQIGLFNR